jgi:hypothetical protein
MLSRSAVIFPDANPASLRVMRFADHQHDMYVDRDKWVSCAVATIFLSRGRRLLGQRMSVEARDEIVRPGFPSG